MKRVTKWNLIALRNESYRGEVGVAIARVGK